MPAPVITNLVKVSATLPAGQVSFFQNTGIAEADSVVLFNRGSDVGTPVAADVAMRVFMSGTTLFYDRSLTAVDAHLRAAVYEIASGDMLDRVQHAFVIPAGQFTANIMATGFDPTTDFAVMSYRFDDAGAVAANHSATLTPLVDALQVRREGNVGEIEGLVLRYRLTGVKVQTISGIVPAGSTGVQIPIPEAVDASRTFLIVSERSSDVGTGSLWSLSWRINQPDGIRGTRLVSGVTVNYEIQVIENFLQVHERGEEDWPPNDGKLVIPLGSPLSTAEGHVSFPTVHAPATNDAAFGQSAVFVFGQQDDANNLSINRAVFPGTPGPNAWELLKAIPPPIEVSLDPGISTDTGVTIFAATQPPQVDLDPGISTDTANDLTAAAVPVVELDAAVSTDNAEDLIAAIMGRVELIDAVSEDTGEALEARIPLQRDLVEAVSVDVGELLRVRQEGEPRIVIVTRNRAEVGPERDSARIDPLQQSAEVGKISDVADPGPKRDRTDVGRKSDSVDWEVTGNE